jgi:hypothetical protein
VEPGYDYRKTKPCRSHVIREDVEELIKGKASGIYKEIQKVIAMRLCALL